MENPPLDGWLWKKGDKGLIVKLRKRFFRVSADAIDYAEDPAKLVSHRLGAIYLDSILAVTLNDFHVSRSRTPGGRGFEIATDTGRTYILVAPSEKELMKWVNFITKLLDRRANPQNDEDETENEVSTEDKASKSPAKGSKAAKLLGEPDAPVGDPAAAITESNTDTLKRLQEISDASEDDSRSATSKDKEIESKSPTEDSVLTSVAPKETTSESFQAEGAKSDPKEESPKAAEEVTEKEGDTLEEIVAGDPKPVENEEKVEVETQGENSDEKSEEVSSTISIVIDKPVEEDETKDQKELTPTPEVSKEVRFQSEDLGQEQEPTKRTTGTRYPSQQKDVISRTPAIEETPTQKDADSPSSSSPPSITVSVATPDDTDDVTVSPTTTAVTSESASPEVSLLPESLPPISADATDKDLLSLESFLEKLSGFEGDSEALQRSATAIYESKVRAANELLALQAIHATLQKDYELLKGSLSESFMTSTLAREDSDELELLRKENVKLKDKLRFAVVENSKVSELEAAVETLSAFKKRYENEHGIVEGKGEDWSVSVSTAEATSRSLREKLTESEAVNAQYLVERTELENKVKLVTDKVNEWNKKRAKDREHLLQIQKENEELVGHNKELTSKIDVLSDENEVLQSLLDKVSMSARASAQVGSNAPRVNTWDIDAIQAALDDVVAFSAEQKQHQAPEESGVSSSSSSSALTKKLNTKGLRVTLSLPPSHVPPPPTGLEEIQETEEASTVGSSNSSEAEGAPSPRPQGETPGSPTKPTGADSEGQAGLDAEISALKESLQQLKERSRVAVLRIAGERDKALEQSTKLDLKLAQCTDVIAELRQKEEELESRHRLLKSSESDYQEALEQKQEELEETQEKLAALQSQCGELEAQVEVLQKNINPMEGEREPSDEEEQLRKEFFFSLAREIKLNSAIRGQRVRFDLATMFQDAVVKSISWRKYDLFIQSQVQKQKQ